MIKKLVQMQKITMTDKLSFNGGGRQPTGKLGCFSLECTKMCIEMVGYCAGSCPAHSIWVNYKIMATMAAAPSSGFTRDTGREGAIKSH